MITKLQYHHYNPIVSNCPPFSGIIIEYYYSLFENGKKSKLIVKVSEMILSDYTSWGKNPTIFYKNCVNKLFPLVIDYLHENLAEELPEIKRIEVTKNVYESWKQNNSVNEEDYIDKFKLDIQVLPEGIESLSYE